jgi:hypothetical protein
LRKKNECGGGELRGGGWWGLGDKFDSRRRRAAVALADESRE